MLAADLCLTESWLVQAAVSNKTHWAASPSDLGVDSVMMNGV